MATKLTFKQFFHVWTQQLLSWLTNKFDSIQIDTSHLATEANATANKNAIITAVNNAQPDLSSVAKQGTNPNATNTAILQAFGNIDFSTLAKESQVKDGNNTTIIVAQAIQQALGTAPVGSDKATIFAWLTSLYDYVVGQDPEDIPEGLGDRINLLLQFFELTQAFEAEDVTEQEAIDVQQEVLDDVWPDCPVGSNAPAWAARRNWADDTEADVRYYNSTIGLQCSPIPVNGPVVYNGYRFYPDGTYESIE